SLTKRLRHPRSQSQELVQRVDELEQRLNRAYIVLNREQTGRLDHLLTRLRALNLARYLEAYHLRLENLNRRLHISWQQSLEQQRMRLGIAQRALQAVSPQATLERGYAIVTGPQGVVRTASQIQPGVKIEAQLARGRIRGEITDILEES